MESLSVRYQKAHGLATALTADASRLEDKLREANKKLAAAEAIAAQMTEEKALLAGSSQTDSDDKARESLRKPYRLRLRHSAEIRCYFQVWSRR